jgi:hypothetical protein
VFGTVSNDAVAKSQIVQRSWFDFATLFYQAQLYRHTAR